jgi:4-alpha-glucanotransferase
MPRHIGCLLPVRSLPSPYGVGGFGEEAFAWIEALARMGATHWQVLPLTANSRGLNPFDCESAHALNHLFIDPAALVHDWLLPHSAARKPIFAGSRKQVSRTTLLWKHRLLHTAWKRFQEGYGAPLRPAFGEFCAAEHAWLNDYALYEALSVHFKGQPWQRWPDKLRQRDGAELAAYTLKLHDRIEQAKFSQFLLYRQWSLVREHAHAHHISIIGDIGIYPSLRGADAWVHQHELTLNSHGYLSRVAGAPPDGFSGKGQYWNSPLYRWDDLERTHFQWPVQRLVHQMRWYDMVKVDHYYGYFQEWSIPAGEKPRYGHWKKSPGAAFFKELRAHIPEEKLIVENLGSGGVDAERYLATSQLMPMRVWQFDSVNANVSREDPYPEHCALYSGTHDTNTLMGWYKLLPRTDRRALARWWHSLGLGNQPRTTQLITPLFSSTAQLVVVQAQDLLGLDNRSRINRPGTIRKNWAWRLSRRQLHQLARMRLQR